MSKRELIKHHCQKAKSEIENVQRLLAEAGDCDDLDRLGQAFLVLNEVWVKMHKDEREGAR